MPQAVQSARVQSASHAKMLQATDSIVPPQGSPSFLWWILICRCRVITPPPHCTLQELQPLQSSRAQSIGHGAMPQSCSISRAGHGDPFTGATVIGRVDRCLPPPQVTVQGSWTHLPTSQSRIEADRPFIIISSPRIFSSAQISEMSSFLLEQQLFDLFEIVFLHLVMLSVELVGCPLRVDLLFGALRMAAQLRIVSLLHLVDLLLVAYARLLAKPLPQTQLLLQVITGVHHSTMDLGEAVIEQSQVHSLITVPAAIRLRGPTTTAIRSAAAELLP